MRINTTILKLPFKKEWFVLWGGDTEELNQHYNTPNQRYAFDFLIVDKNNISHKGNGQHNNDYYAFGKEIFSPADGLVVKIIDSIIDNIPGQMNKKAITGNAIVIEHNKQEFSVLAHLKQGSLQVKVGDKVKSGQIIGLCGNSGNSSEPHLHYHLQDSDDIYNGEGIKCYFQDVELRRNNKEELKDKYSPVRNDIIRLF